MTTSPTAPKSPYPSVNALTAPLVERLVADAAALRLAVTTQDGARMIDAGASVRGSIEAGRRIAEICLGGLGTVTIAPSGPVAAWPYSVVVHAADPVIACLGSQYAGWSLADETGDSGFFALGSGPGRAVAVVEDLYAELGYRDTATQTALVLEAAGGPPASVIAKVAEATGLGPEQLTFIYAPTQSLAGSTQVVARVLEVALHKAHTVGFAKPLAHTAGSSMHIHQSVVDSVTGANVFSDDQGEPTALFRQFIAGQQACMADFTALFAPNVNSYQRLCHPFASPNNACWSHDNRAAGLRIPASGPSARRVENRLPGADANPYLAIAASLAAGLYGIDQQLEPTPPTQGDIHVPDELSLPCTLHAALERLKRSQLAKELFGVEFIEGYIASKTLELTSFFDEITPWERRILAAQA